MKFPNRFPAFYQAPWWARAVPGGDDVQPRQYPYE